MGTLKGSILSRYSHTGEGFKAQRRELIEKWLEEYDIKNYTINDDFTIDVNGDIDLLDEDLIEFPDYIQFELVKGYFNCSFCQLTSLRGVPRIVKGYFDCSHNNLTSLEGAPKKCHNFYCYSNYLTSLKGSPEKVLGGFDCRYNKLTSLEEAPREVRGYFDCSNNYLTSLKGSPEKVEVGFYCRSNKLTSLEGAPRETNYFYCSNNSINFTEEDVRKVCKVKEEIYCK